MPVDWLFYLKAAAITMKPPMISKADIGIKPKQLLFKKINICNRQPA